MLLAFDDDVNAGADLDFNRPILGMPSFLSRLGFTYTRNFPKTVYQNGAIVTLAANQFGTTFDHVTDRYGYLSEPAAANLVSSSAGAVATWTATNVTDAVTPIAGFTNSIQFGDNSIIRAAYKNASLTAGTVYSVSIFVQMDDGLAPVVGTSTASGDMTIRSESTVHTNAALVTFIGNGIYRVSSSRTASATGSAPCGIAKSVTQSARSFRIIGIQVEAGARATSYIATSGGTATRPADVLISAVTNIPGFNPAAYTVFTESRFDAPYPSATAGRRWSIDDGTANNAASVTVNSIGNQSLACVSAGVTVASIPLTVSLARTKCAASFAQNSFLISADGVAGTADTAGAMPVNPTHFRIGHRYDNVQQCNHMIFRIRLIPAALNQAQLTALTV